jgi:hypothetical protein
MALALHAGGLVEQLAHHVEHRADAGGPVGELARAPLDVLDQLGDRIDRQRRVDGQAGHRLDRGGERGEILDRVVGQALHQVHGGDVRAGGGGEQRVAVRRGAGDHARADRAVGAGAVLDHDGLAERVADLTADLPGDEIERAGRERHHHRDRLRRRPALRHGRLDSAEAEQRQAAGQAECNEPHRDCLAVDDRIIGWTGERCEMLETRCPTASA